MQLLLFFSSGKCVCHECFIKDISTGKCYTCTDYMYSETKHTCGTDSRPRQLTAFLLSFFLSYIGAANIYIEQYSLGKVRLSHCCDYIIL